MTFNVLCF